jgi:hypothetical protein
MLDHMGRSKRPAKLRDAQPGPQHQEPGGPSGPAQRISQLSPARVLDRIERAQLARQATEAELRALVDHAVGLRIGWPEIAAQIRMSGQSGGDSRHGWRRSLARYLQRDSAPARARPKARPVGRAANLLVRTPTRSTDLKVKREL